MCRTYTGILAVDKASRRRPERGSRPARDSRSRSSRTCGSATPGSGWASPRSTPGLPSIMGSYWMTLHLGWAKNQELSYTGRFMDCDECERLGLLAAVVEADPRDPRRAKELAGELAAKAPARLPPHEGAFSRARHARIRGGVPGRHAGTAGRLRARRAPKRSWRTSSAAGPEWPPGTEARPETSRWPRPLSPSPASHRRVSVTSVAVFGLGALIAFTAGAVLWLGLGSAVESTRSLVSERSDAVLDSLERELRSRLDPVTEQARWITSLVADGKLDLQDRTRLDDFMFGALAATPQVAGIGFFRPNGTGRAWYRQRTGRGKRGPVGGRKVPGVGCEPDDGRSRPPGRTRSGSTPWAKQPSSTTLPCARTISSRGMIGQIVLVEELSRDITGNAPPFTTPFVLHRGRQVLAHPALIRWSPIDTDESRPLATVEEVGDRVLAALGTEATREGRWLARSGPGNRGDVGGAGRHLASRAATQAAPLRRVDGRRTCRHERGRRQRDTQNDGSRGRRVRGARRRSRPRGARRPAGSAARYGLSRPPRASSRTTVLDDVRPLRPSWILEMDDANRSFNRMVEGLSRAPGHPPDPRPLRPGAGRPRAPLGRAGVSSPRR